MDKQQIELINADYINECGVAVCLSNNLKSTINSYYKEADLLFNKPQIFPDKCNALLILGEDENDVQIKLYEIISLADENDISLPKSFLCGGIFVHNEKLIREMCSYYETVLSMDMEKNISEIDSLFNTFRVKTPGEIIKKQHSSLQKDNNYNQTLCLYGKSEAQPLDNLFMLSFDGVADKGIPQLQACGSYKSAISQETLDYIIKLSWEAAECVWLNNIVIKSIEEQLTFLNDTAPKSVELQRIKEIICSRKTIENQVTAPENVGEKKWLADLLNEMTGKVYSLFARTISGSKEELLTWYPAGASTDKEGPLNIYNHSIEIEGYTVDIGIKQETPEKGEFALACDVPPQNLMKLGEKYEDLAISINDKVSIILKRPFNTREVSGKYKMTGTAIFIIDNQEIE